jgi:hypothetical protein
MKLGWVFYRDEWNNGHNGDLEIDYYFRSPRMEKPSRVFIAQYKDQPGLTEDSLLNSEAGVLALRLINYHENAIKDDLNAIKDDLYEILKKRFRCSKKLSADDLKFSFTIKL